MRHGHQTRVVHRCLRMEKIQVHTLRLRKVKRSLHPCVQEEAVDVWRSLRDAAPYQLLSSAPAQNPTRNRWFLLFRKLRKLIQLRYIQHCTASRAGVRVLELVEGILAAPDGCHFHSFGDETLRHRLADARCCADEEDMLVWERHFRGLAGERRWPDLADRGGLEWVRDVTIGRGVRMEGI